MIRSTGMLMRKSIVVVLAVFSLTDLKAYGEPQSPEVQTAIAAVDAAIASLQQKPNQFNVQANCSGLNVNQSGNGIGLYNNTTGGGPGSQTTGFKVELSDAKCAIVSEEAVNRSSEQAIALLKDIRLGLQETKINEPSLLSKLATFGQTFVAPVLPDVIIAVVKKALHLS